jgi:DNA-binding CsgD family transcriptional regulator/PAS domain-containing protein
MRDYVKACKDVFASGLVQEEAIIKHIEQQIIIEKNLPKSSSFFCIVDVNTGKYHFLGSQHKNVTGYSNEEFLSRGIELFFANLHSDDVDIIVHKVFRHVTDIVNQAPPDDKRKFQFQYNYRYRTKNGKYINILEHLYVLELDENGRGALFLGNPTVIDTSKVLPIRFSAKIIRSDSIPETVLTKTYSHTKVSLENLTPREMDILRHLSLGKTSKQIGRDLHISPHTVNNHRQSLLNKLGCRSVVELTLIAFKNGLM